MSFLGGLLGGIGSVFGIGGGGGGKQSSTTSVTPTSNVTVTPTTNVSVPISIQNDYQPLAAALEQAAQLSTKSEERIAAGQEQVQLEASGNVKTVALLVVGAVALLVLMKK